MRQSQVVAIVQDTLRSDGVATTRGLVGQVTETFLAAISQVLRGGNTVTLRGFGTFYVHRYEGRQGLKPHKPRWQPKFRAGRTFKATVNSDR